MNTWAALFLALVLVGAGKYCYVAGSASRQGEIDTANTRTSTANARSLALETALSEQNEAARKFAANSANDEKKRKLLRKEEEKQATEAEKRLAAANDVTTGTDDVLRAYWEAYGQ